jgi:transposase
MNEDSETENLVLERALAMRAKGYKMNAIAKELNVHVGTVRRWFRKIGLPAAKNGFDRAKEKDVEEEVTDQLAVDLEDNLEFYAEDTIRLAKHDARIAEDSAMMDIAEAQSTPADKYQHYIAAAGIKILRDSIKNLKGPKTVRELSELDQLIRRNLGLNAKSGGGQSKMHIDISILNNSKADRGDGTVTKMKPTIIDIDP